MPSNSFSGMAEERLQPISLHQEMQRSYLEYAMSVIVGRALPDARDGLKPVQRRILYAMHELGLTPDKPYRKCARVVGDVLGKYHPHGDQAVYDALVRLVQDFASRYPVLEGHGNFGSVDDDPPAAMRYTETRIAEIANEGLLKEIGSETVDFGQNFDGSQQEPLVLPAQLPFLLLNGCSGIAVGMATSIPPHNLNEIVDGLIALIRKPELSNEKLSKLIPGPDFPTGGEVLLGTGVKESYLKGRGSIPMRGLTHVEEIQPGKGKHKRNAIIITELPYQISKAGWIEKLADIVNEGKIGGIADIRDESDRDGMRIVVELRRDGDHPTVLKDLYRRTSLQSNFGTILLALVNGQPKQLSLKELLCRFIEYREITVTKRTKYLLKKTSTRLNILEGLLKALKDVRKVINLIEKANDSSEAKIKLMVNMEINEQQADAVLGMPLRKLTNLEQNSILKEANELKEKKIEFEKLLKNRDQLLDTIINELKILKKKFGNKRLTRLIDGGDELIAERNAQMRPNAELQRQNAYKALPSDGKLLIQEDNQIKIVSPQIIGRLHLTESCKLGEEVSPAKIIWPIKEKPRILAITKHGKIALVKWEFVAQKNGTLETFLPGGIEDKEIIQILPLPLDETLGLGLLSSDGRFKRLSINDVLDLSGRAASIVKLKDGVYLKSAVICYPEGEIILASDFGRIIKMKVNDENIPVMGKLAQGPQIMRLFPKEKIIAATSCKKNSNDSIAIVTRKGKIYKLNITSLRACKRSDIGDIIVPLEKLESEFNPIVDLCNSSNLISIMTNKNRSLRLKPEEIGYLAEENTNLLESILKNEEFVEKIIPLIKME